MLGYEDISDLVVSWALRRGESVGVKRNEGIDDRLAEALDRLGRVVWARLQEDSAWVNARSKAVDVPLTKHRVQFAIEAAADQDRVFWYRIHGVADEIQTLVDEDPASAKAAGIALQPSRPATPPPRELPAAALLAVAALATVALVVVVVGIWSNGSPGPETVAGGVTSEQGRSRQQEPGDQTPGSDPGRLVADGNGTQYRVGSTELTTVSRFEGRVATGGLTFVGLRLAVTNPDDAEVTLEPAPVTLAVPLDQAEVEGAEVDGRACEVGEAAGTVSGGYCRLPMTAGAATTALAPGETRTLDYGNDEPLPADLDLSRVRVYQGDRALPRD